jgi:hypothetical protein
MMCFTSFAWAFLIVALACFVSMGVATLAALRVSAKIAALERRYRQLEDDYIEIQCQSIPGWINQQRNSQS